MNKDDLSNKFFTESFSETEAVIWKELLETDAAFADEVSFQKKVKKQLHLQKRATLKTELQAFERKSKRTIPLNWQWLSVAALLLFSVCIWVFVQKSDPDKNLYQAYYQPFPNVTAPTVRGINDSSEKSAAMNLYDTEDYAAALPLFEKLYQQESADYSYFYQGICHLELGNTAKTITLFENANYTELKPWKNVTDWYLALAYLKIGNDEKAKLQLQQVITTNEFMAKQAKELLAEL